MYFSLTYWILLASSLLVYWAVPARARFWLIGAISIAFIFQQDLRSGIAVLSFAGAALLSFRLAPGRAKQVSAALIAGAVAHLLIRKQMTSLLPLGLSYFTFRYIDFVARTAGGHIGAEPPAKVLAYFFFFPIFPAGPIERYEDFQARLTPGWDWNRLAAGMTRIVHGLVKKLAIADPFLLPSVTAAAASRFWDHPASYSALDVWGKLACFFAYIYLDFSAYSDIAIGSAALFGFAIGENFNLPFLATSLSDFWNRWHISLSRICRRYVYTPFLAYTRNVYVALAATLIVIGLWHDGTWRFFLWGVYHAFGLCIAAFYRRILPPRPAGRFATAASLAAGWAATMLFVVSACAFLVPTQAAGMRAGFAVLGKLVGIPAKRQMKVK